MRLCNEELRVNEGVVFIRLPPFEYQLSSRRLFDLMNYLNYREMCLNIFLLSQKLHLSYDVDKPSQCISLASRAVHTRLGQIGKLLNLFCRS